MTTVIEVIGASSIEARQVLSGCTTGPAEPLTTWAVGAWAGWHAAHLASVWDRGVIVDTDSKGSTLDAGRRIRADRRQATVLAFPSGRTVVSVRFADAMRLIDQRVLPSRLVTAVRQVLSDREAVSRADREAFDSYLETGCMPPDHHEWRVESARVERECQRLASEAWACARPNATLFDLFGMNTGSYSDQGGVS